MQESITPTYTTRTTCRCCQSDDLVELFTLNNQYVNGFVSIDIDQTTLPRCPIELQLCKACTLVQAKHTAPQELLYTGHYWYTSGRNESMRKSLAEVAHAIESRINLLPGDIVLDIGSNDGTLLRSYKIRGFEYQRMSDPGEAIFDCDYIGVDRDRPITVGIEPAKNLATVGKEGVDILVNDFWSYDVYVKELIDAGYEHRWGHNKGDHRAKVITALGMFYDLEDPSAFIADVAKVLDPEGIFVAQLMCLKQTVLMEDVGNLTHEHLEFYSLHSLQLLLAKHGLVIFDLEENSVNGGSYRLWCCHQDTSWIKSQPINSEQNLRIIDALAVEEQLKLDEPDTYFALYQRMNRTRQRVVSFIKKEVEAVKKVWVYGASTKGNVILQWYNLDSALIQAAADRSPDKHGRVTVGSNIVIHSEEEFRHAQPDYALVLPYAFLSSFIERESEWLKKGGKFIVPLPVPRLISLNADTPNVIHHEVL